MKIINNKYVIKFLLIITIFFLDRISKIYILDFFEKNQLQELIIFNFLSFYLVWNEGIAFGLLDFDNQLLYNFWWSLRKHI
mgnify:CR=1 FL=1